MAIIHVRNHDLRRAFAEAPGGNPSNLEDDLGTYHRVWVVAGAVNYKRADVIRPPFDWTTKVFTPPEGKADTYPRVVKEPWGRLLVIFQRASPPVGEALPASDAMLTTSDDDGETWEAPTVAITGGRKPRIRVGRDGTILTAALVATGGSGDPFHIQVTRQDPGELDPTDPYTVMLQPPGTSPSGDDPVPPDPLEVANDTFDMDQGRSGDAPWLLVAVKSGEASPTEFQSWDELESVTEIS